METYISRHQNTVTQYIETRPITGGGAEAGIKGTNKMVVKGGFVFSGTAGCGGLEGITD